MCCYIPFQTLKEALKPTSSAPDNPTQVQEPEEDVPPVQTPEPVTTVLLADRNVQTHHVGVQTKKLVCSI